MSKTLHEELEALHNEGVKLFDIVIEVYGIKKIYIKILDWILKVKEGE